MRFAFGRHPHVFSFGGKVPPFCLFLRGKNRKIPTMKTPTFGFFMGRLSQISNLRQTVIMVYHHNDENIVYKLNRIW